MPGACFCRVTAAVLGRKPVVVDGTRYEMHYSSSTAASAAPNAVPVEGADEGTGQAASMKTADAGFGQADGSTAPLRTIRSAGRSQMPQPPRRRSLRPCRQHPPPQHPPRQILPQRHRRRRKPCRARSQAQRLGARRYYAVITIKGPMPEIIASNARLDNGNGTFTLR